MIPDQADTCPECGYSNNQNPDYPFCLNPGTVLRQRYLVGRVLGFGGFGITYIGYDFVLHRKIAIKEFFPKGLANRQTGTTVVSVYSREDKEQFDTNLSSFISEAQNLAKFQDIKGIVQIYDCIMENQTGYIIMEYLEGRNFKQILNEQGQLSVEEAKQVVLKVLEILEQVHSKGLIHRDISPDNIFRLQNGEIRLIDFGAARKVNVPYSITLTVLLKPGYTPEEQYRSKGKQGPWTDIYALGATFYRLITGKIPESSLERLKGVELMLPSTMGIPISPEDERALVKSLCVDPEDRFQTAEEFARALTEGSISEGQGTVRKTQNASAGKKRSFPVGLLFLLLVILASSAAAILFFQYHQMSIPSVTVSDPENTETPADTGVSAPTSIPEQAFTNMPMPTHTPIPADTLWPTNILVAEETPMPVYAPDNSPTPTIIPIPTNTPVPTNTPTPTNTPVPASTPTPTNTPVPANTPIPADTPVPTSTSTFASASGDGSVSSETEKKPAVIASGECGEDAKYKLYDSGRLVISGKGKVNDHFALSLTNSLEKTAKIIKLTLAEGIESAGIYSLNFQDLKSVKLPGSLKKIDSFTFRGCTRLKKAEIPNLEFMGAEVFKDCSGLLSVSIDGSISRIPAETFSSCTKLTDITLPEGITSIGTNAFADCENLSEIHFLGNVEQWHAIQVEAGNNSLWKAAIYCRNGETTMPDQAQTPTPAPTVAPSAQGTAATVSYNGFTDSNDNADTSQSSDSGSTSYDESYSPSSYNDFSSYSDAYSDASSYGDSSGNSSGYSDSSGSDGSRWVESGSGYWSEYANDGGSGWSESDDSYWGDYASADDSSWSESNDSYWDEYVGGDK